MTGGLSSVTCHSAMAEVSRKRLRLPDNKSSGVVQILCGDDHRFGG
ncbi:MAG: hypothetical protein WDA27_07750 [Actinomycetota bacterium]